MKPPAVPTAPSDLTTAGKLPVNPADFPAYGTQKNLTFASLPLTLMGIDLATTVKSDRDPDGDLRDVGDDVGAITRAGSRAVPWGWFEEGYDREPSNPEDGPATADGTHAAYVTHHNGPQYFGYVANNPVMSAHLHGLDDFRRTIDHRELPAAGGVFYLKGGSQNLLGLKPADPDAAVQTRFVGDDDHPAYSDAQISEAMVADLVNRIRRVRIGKTALSSSPGTTPRATTITSFRAFGIRFRARHRRVTDRASH